MLHLEGRGRARMRLVSSQGRPVVLGRSVVAAGPAAVAYKDRFFTVLPIKILHSLNVCERV